MDLVVRSLRRHRRRWLLLVAVAASGFSAYKLYRLPAVARRRQRLARLLGSLAAVADAAASSAEAVALVSSDLNSFLRSDSDDIPSSLRQISKVARSDEFAGSLARVSEAMTVGVVRGFRSSLNSMEPERGTTPGFSDRVFDKVFSAEGVGLASTIAGSFARGLVIGFYSKKQVSGGATAGSSKSDSDWVQLICSDNCREMIGDCIQLFVSTAVAVYIDKTMDMNFFDDLFAGLTNSKHEGQMKNMLVSVCNEAVETLVTTSHQVLTSSNSTSSSSSAENRAGEHEQEENLNIERQRRSSIEQKGKDGGGWVDQVKSTLAVPGNRKFVVDVTGRITFETIRLFVEYAVLSLYDGGKRGINQVQQELVESGREVVKFFSAKSRVMITICISLCMHILIGTRLLMPA